MLRESPTLQSLGRTGIEPVAGGGFKIDSFFDVFTEISLDGGQTWSASDTAGHMALHNDPGAVPTALVEPHFNGNQPSFTLVSQSGLRYILQCKNDFNDAEWITLSTTSGNGQTLILSDPSAAGLPKRFYRVAIQEDDPQ